MEISSRPIQADERSGVLDPTNLERYNAQWVQPDPSIADVVDHFWTVRWRLDAGEMITQRIIATPAVTLTVESGHVPAPLVITGVYSGAWERDITGWGEVFAIRLRPAGLAVLTDLPPESISDATIPLDESLDPRAHRLLRRVRTDGATVEERVTIATELIIEALAEHPLTSRQRLANDVVAAIRDGRDHSREAGEESDSTRRPTGTVPPRTGAPRAGAPGAVSPRTGAPGSESPRTVSSGPESPRTVSSGSDSLRTASSGPGSPRTMSPRTVSPRTVQRALKETIGHGPKWVARWVRLQEVARRLADSADSDGTGGEAARIAAELGYADQSHMVNDFRAAVGITPSAYLRSVRTLSGLRSPAGTAD